MSFHAPLDREMSSWRGHGRGLPNLQHTSSKEGPKDDDNKKTTSHHTEEEDDYYSLGGSKDLQLSEYWPSGPEEEEEVDELEQKTSWWETTNWFRLKPNSNKSTDSDTSVAPIKSTAASSSSTSKASSLRLSGWFADEGDAVEYMREDDYEQSERMDAKVTKGIGSAAVGDQNAAKKNTKEKEKLKQAPGGADVFCRFITTPKPPPSASAGPLQSNNNKQDSTHSNSNECPTSSPNLTEKSAPSLLARSTSSDSSNTAGQGSNKTDKNNNKSSRRTAMLRLRALKGLDASVKKQIHEYILLPLLHPLLFRSLGVQPPRGVLLSGMSGSGKTRLVYNIVQELNIYFQGTSAPNLMVEFLNYEKSNNDRPQPEMVDPSLGPKYSAQPASSTMNGTVGMFSEMNDPISLLFRTAEKNQPSLLFFDDLDVLIKSSAVGENPVMPKIRAVFRANFERLSQFNRNVCIIGSISTGVDAIDASLLRTGRFDKCIQLNKPDSVGRLEILAQLTQGMKLHPSVDLALLAEQTVGFLPADLDQLCSEAAVICIRQHLLMEKYHRQEEKETRRRERRKKNMLIRKRKMELKQQQQQQQAENSVASSTMNDGPAGNNPSLSVEDREEADTADDDSSNSDIEIADKHAAAVHKDTHAQVPPIPVEIPASSLNSLLITQQHFFAALVHLRPSAARTFQSTQGGSNSIPHQQSWDDVGGVEDLKSTLIENISDAVKYPGIFRKFGLSQNSGILLYGPPGVGKTLIARAIAQHAKCSFLSIRGPEILSSYLGDSEAKIREIFQKARNAAPCVLFFDEIDSIAVRRANGKSDATIDRVLNQLLTEMDHRIMGDVPDTAATGQNKKKKNEKESSSAPSSGAPDDSSTNTNDNTTASNKQDEEMTNASSSDTTSEATKTARPIASSVTPPIFIIGATNRPELLDPALLRPGRLDHLLFVGLPDKKSRKDILHKLLRHTPLESHHPVHEEDATGTATSSTAVSREADTPERERIYDWIATQTARFSGADLAHLCNIARKNAINKFIKRKKERELRRQQGVDEEELLRLEEQDALEEPLVLKSDIIHAFTLVTPSVSEEMLEHYRKFNAIMKKRGPQQQQQQQQQQQPAGLLQSSEQQQVQSEAKSEELSGEEQLRRRREKQRQEHEQAQLQATQAGFSSSTKQAEDPRVTALKEAFMTDILTKLKSLGPTVDPQVALNSFLAEMLKDTNRNLWKPSTDITTSLAGHDEQVMEDDAVLIAAATGEGEENDHEDDFSNLGRVEQPAQDYTNRPIRGSVTK